MQLTEGLKLTIYTSESARHGHKVLHDALVELLRGQGIAGVTVWRGIESYGADRHIHTAKIVDLSTDLPIVVVAIDRPEKIEALLPQLDALVGKGLVTLESSQIVFSRPAAI